ncbi:MAG: hypothetical protein A2487_16860 [Candidatus Raymondbacteria bacterium RifOxyC12_full_50_8]|uniref:SMP-30/Gluconolactonase/LRE-like region domain-containing protein n=1 Tax=Candidatus Raymondbacteria bacterium RIFOXYD12_FULL_49_13 TaxID=1817890 RepID=A0A1F7F083_UNCRA|nr:MAG: hypothetical protein A2248_21735 [Candidatus Raymondbacteria bacterium RIFOXYA2_FULL_49_16]OGK00060.1 MAG: hypothetical protein A2519_22290 [Candidatus Raymondbacteria bacterium RIFOXYD12_FULL_49_13]OGK01350.1 MAG: hypothetical protein A2487_16860 [Candidatus Raymondbacteria bacterium RifOxyC12_full_50_8]OGK03677.1 MAG: hypothetical protein A2350_12970 [Candidatus Raymondbacteria bacterium RifOxyB12_full_50_8]OGP45049.1 MAG: hypothetical protein A2324_13615 [Candidatus Raymondbacteria b
MINRAQLLFLFSLCALLRAHAKDVPTTLVFPPYFHSYGIQRATQTKLALLLPFKTRFHDPRGIAVTKMITRDDTTTEDDDDEVTVYGVNSGKNQIIYNHSMYTLGLWGARGSGADEMRDPTGVACDEKGNVYICDTGNNRVVWLFNPKREVLFKSHLGIGLLKKPTHIALDGNGNLYIADTGNDRILIMTYSGVVLREFHSLPGCVVRQPLGIAVNTRSERWVYYRHDFLFFLNDSGKTLVRVDLENNEALQVSPDALIGKKTTHEYMAADYYGNIYLTDKKRGCVDKFTMNLVYLTSFGKSGTGDREFDEPRGICIWKRYGQTFMAERAGAQYYWVGTDVRAVSLAPEKTRGNRMSWVLAGDLTEPSYVSLYLLGAQGDTLETLFSKRRSFPKTFTRVFACNKPVVGADRWLAIFEPTYSSYTYFQKPVTLPYGKQNTWSQK